MEFNFPCFGPILRGLGSHCHGHEHFHSFGFNLRFDFTEFIRQHNGQFHALVVNLPHHDTDSIAHGHSHFDLVCYFYLLRHLFGPSRCR